MNAVILFLCGDVMTGRGIDQILPQRVSPRLYESCVRSALDYVALAEEANGPIPKPVPYAYIPGQPSMGSVERTTCMPATAKRRKAASASSV